MSFLCSDSLKSNIKSGNISVTPSLEDRQYGQCSIDLRLGTKIKRLKRPFFRKTFDIREKAVISKSVDIIDKEKGFILKPNEMILTTSQESIKLPNNMFGLVTGRASLSMLGLEVHLTQDLKPPGHEGHVLLQIKNNSVVPLRLFQGMRVAQLMVGLLDNDCVGYHDSDNKHKKGEDPLEFTWRKDAELKEKDIIVKKFDWDNLLKLLLIISGILTAAFFISDIVTPTPLQLATCITFLLILLVRIFTSLVKNK